MYNCSLAETNIEDVRQETQISGEELFQRYLSGDENAFEDLVALYSDDLSHFIDGKINDFYETKYLTIEAFGQLAVNGRKFSGQSSLKTYLFTIARNLVAKHLKDRSKNTHISYDEIVETVSLIQDAPDVYLEREETREKLLSAMELLIKDYNQVLTLLYFDDMSYLQAGKVMGKSEKQIKNLAHRAKDTLKRILEEDSNFARQF
jgi:RNA polymerase sigma-70 factor (ECF subfamily)